VLAQWVEAEGAGLVQPGEGKTTGDLRAACQHLQSVIREMKTGSSQKCLVGGGANGRKLKWERFRRGGRRIVVTIRSVTRWCTLPREAARSPSWEKVGMWLHEAPGSRVWSGSRPCGVTALRSLPSELCCGSGKAVQWIKGNQLLLGSWTGMAYGWLTSLLVPL